MAPSDFYVPGFLPPPCVCVCVRVHLCAGMPVYCVQACGGGVLSEYLHVSTCVYVCMCASMCCGGFNMYVFIFLAVLGLNCGTWDLLLGHTDSLAMAHRLSPLSSGLVAPQHVGS